MKPRLLVVEDDEAIRSGLEVKLRAEGYDVRAHADGLDIMSAIEEFQPDLAVLDISLQVGPDGFELARTLRKFSDLPVVFLTAADDVDSRLAGFEAGADDYLVKPFAMAELLARCKALLRRSGRLESPALQFADVVLDEAAHTVTRAGQPLHLTQIEYELLSLLIRNPGRVLSKSRLLGQVWGFEQQDANIVEVHISALRRKLEAHGPRLLHTVRGVGYVLKE